MNSTTNLTLNMQLPNYATIAYAVQGDTLGRKLVCTLVDGSAPWTPPAQSAAVIRYIKPDGTIGFYDTLENGDPAVTISGNVATITLAGQMLAVAGDVIVQLNFYDPNSILITAFSFRLLVQSAAVNDLSIISTDYFNVLTEAIAAGAEVAAQLTFPVPVENGGTGATTAAGVIDLVSAYSTDNCTLADGVTASGTPVFSLQKCGKTVILRLSVDVTSGLAANTYITIATIPAGYVPRAQVMNMCMTGSATIGQIVATTGGNVRVAPNTAFSSSDTANIRCELVWFVS